MSCVYPKRREDAEVIKREAPKVKEFLRTTSRSYSVTPVTSAAATEQCEENVKDRGGGENWKRCRSQQAKREYTDYSYMILGVFFHLSFLKT